MQRSLRFSVVAAPLSIHTLRSVPIASYHIRQSICRQQAAADAAPEEQQSRQPLQEETVDLPLWEEYPYEEETDRGYRKSLKFNIKRKQQRKRDAQLAQEGWTPIFEDRFASITFDDFNGVPRLQQLSEIVSEMERELKMKFESEMEKDIEEEKAEAAAQTALAASQPQAAAATAQKQQPMSLEEQYATLDPVFEKSFAGYVEKLKFEFRWRYQDLRDAYGQSLPDPKNLRTPKSLPLQEHIDIFRMANKFFLEEMKATVRVMLRYVRIAAGLQQRSKKAINTVRDTANVVLEEQKRQQQRIMEQLGLAGQQHAAGDASQSAQPQQSQQPPAYQENPIAQMLGLTQRPGEHQTPMQEFLKDRAQVLMNSVNQFIVGYYEGSGRDASQAKLFGSEVKKPSFDKNMWINTVSKVARKARDITDEMQTLIKVDESELHQVQNKKSNTQPTQQQPGPGQPQQQQPQSDKKE